MYDGLDGVQILTREWAIWEAKMGQPRTYVGYAQTCPLQRSIYSNRLIRLSTYMVRVHRWGVLDGCTLAQPGEYD